MARQFFVGVRLLAMQFVSYLVGLGPMPVTIGRMRYWVDPKTGRLLPAVAGAEDPPEPKPEPKDPPEPKPEPKDPPDDEPVKPDDDWQAKARKHERDLKKERTKREAAEAALAEKEKESQTDSEKAIANAKEEGRKEAETAAQTERRKDRLDVEITKLGAKGFKVGDQDDVKVADSAIDDTVLHIQRRIDAGEIDADDIFDDQGKVKTDALKSALGELLEEKPHLKAGAAGTTSGKPSGESDAGKGEPPKGQLKSTQGMTADEIAKATQEGRLDDYLKSHN